MEQWMKDGRHILYERWQSMGGVVGSKSHPQQVKDVDDAVLKHVLAVFTKNRLHACVASPLLHKANCRLVAIDEADEPSLHFKFPCGRFFPGIDRSGFFGFVQRQFHSSDFLSPAVLHSATSSPSSSSPHRNVVPLMPNQHARVLVDYMWIYQGRIYDYTSDFSFIAGAGVVPQALEESVLYCNRNRHAQPVEAVYLAARTWDDSEEEQHKAQEEQGMFDDETGKKFDSRLVEGAVFLDEMDQFLCDSGFAFRDEGTKLPATEFNVGYDVKTGKVMAVKATEPPMVIPGDATVALFVRVKKFCDPVSATKHIEIAEKLKKKGNDILQGGGAETKENSNNNNNNNNEQQQQQDQGQKAISARQWYERAMMELSPEALRISEKTGGSGELQNKEITGKIQNLLASLAHNISLSYFEEAMYRGNVEFSRELLASDEKLRIKVQNTRQHLLKKSITFATEAIKASGNKHTKSIFRRAVANFHLGNYDEAKSDLKLIETVGGVEAVSKDASVVGLMNQIQSEIKKADDAFRHAMQKELGKQKE